MSSAPKRPLYLFEGFRLDAQHRILSRADGQAIPLAPKAFDTLLYFLERPGQLLDKRTLLGAIWPHVIVEENSLNQTISQLRRVLGERPEEHRFIVTEPSRGFRFVAPVSILGDQEAGVPEAPVTAKGIESPPASGPRKPQSLWFFAMAAVVALAFAWFWQGRPQGAVLPNSVAVLPFADESADPSQPWIVDSLHIEIISKLGQLGLNVINREAVLAYLENNAPSHAEIAAAFRVRSILVGTIRYADDQIRVEARLVDPATDVDLWSLAPHQSHLLSVFEAEAAIATSVATRLNAEFSVAEQRRIETRPTVSLNAAQRYYEALAGLHRESRTDTLRLLKEATELDPTFALAHSQLALLRARSSIDWGTDPAGALTPEEFAQEVRASAERALHLDGGSTIASAIAHAALGELNMYSWRWTEAESDLAKAFELGGNGPDLPIYYAEFLTFRGKYDAALPMAERYAELNPTLPDPYARTHTPSLWFIWLAHVYAGNTDEAIEYLGQHLRLRPNDWAARLNLGFTELHRKNYGAAEAAFDSVERVTAGRRSPTNAAALAYVYARIGRTEKAMHLFQEIQKTSDPVSDGTWALAYLAIGDRAHSLERLDGAIERIKRHEPDAGWFNLMMFKHNLTGDPTLDEPEFRERREQIAGT